jgi:DNA-directed RNA polymerase specialized sigma24 family protein/CheY-like chemotaxis protein
MFPQRPHSCKKLNNVHPINRFRVLELFSMSALKKVTRRRERGEPAVSETVSKSQTIAQHVPYLRRYARALTGNQALGDSYVTATLEALVKEPHRLGLVEVPQSKVELFRIFSLIWNSAKPSSIAEQAVDLTPADRRLAQITAMPRQAFLLVSLEGFSEDQAATILNIDKQTLKELVEESGQELAAQIATDILIIEDEALIALDLENIVEGLGHRTIGIARTRTEAIALAKNKRPGLILADIQLADGSSGLEAVNDLLTTFEVPVIFITAYPERFLTGERPEPAFLVSKPYQQSTVSALVSQALFFERNAVQRKRRAIG